MSLEFIPLTVQSQVLPEKFMFPVNYVYTWYFHLPW